MQLADEEREQIRRVLPRVQGPRDVPRRGAEGGREEEAEGDLRGHAGQGPLRGLAPQKWKRAAAPMGWRQRGENLGRSTEKTVDKTIGTSPDQIKAVCDAYFKGDLAQEAICDAYGYPSQATLSRWIRHDERYAAFVQANKRKKAEPATRSTIKRPFAVRLKAVKMALEDGMTLKEVSDKFEVCGAPMVSKWVTVYRQKGLDGLLTKDDIKQQPLAGADREIPDDVDALKREVEALRLEKAILKQKIDILKTPASTSGNSRKGRKPRWSTPCTGISR